MGNGKICEKIGSIPKFYLNVKNSGESLDIYARTTSKKCIIINFEDENRAKFIGAMKWSGDSIGKNLKFSSQITKIELVTFVSGKN